MNTQPMTLRLSVDADTHDEALNKARTLAARWFDIPETHVTATINFARTDIDVDMYGTQRRETVTYTANITATGTKPTTEEH